MTELPPPPPLTSGEIVGIIRAHWLATGMGWNDADRRGELGFAYMLDAGTIREWGFDPMGETLYEPCSPVAQTIVYVLKEEK
jgi:hypothetical protein